MQILVLSSDNSLLSSISSKGIDNELHFKVYSQIADEMDGISKIYTQNPNLIILDDDLIKPNSLRYIQTIKKANKKLKIIFLTSDNSVEFGREIVSSGVDFYVIKPLEEDELEVYIQSASKQINTFN